MFGTKKKRAAKAAAERPETVDQSPEEADLEPAAAPADGAADTTEMDETPAPAEATSEAAPADAPAAEWSEPPSSNGATEGNGANGASALAGRHDDKPLSQHLKLNDLLNEPAPKSEDQRQREAAAELEAAFAESRQKLLQEVPGASSPEEATRLLEEQRDAREVLPDDEGARLSNTDIYWSDSSVYYRVRKHFLWGPQRGPYRKPWTPPPGLARPEVGGSPRGRLPSPE